MQSIVLAGGGTAGHTSPLIATAKAAQRAADCDITCIGTAKGLETRVIPAAGLELKLIEPVPLPRRPNADLLRLPARFRRAVRQARQILEDADADVLIGFGGYVSIPAYLAARKLGVPIVVHEANALPGIANKVGARFAAVVATTFPGSPLPKAKLIGMPVSRNISHPSVDEQTARAHFGLDADRPTLLVSGGSQGAVSINDALINARSRLLEAGVQVLHVLGPKNFGEANIVVTGESGAKYIPVAFVEDMAYAYAAADFMVGRCGAGTVVETAMSGLPCLFVPFPHGNGEQGRNAAPLVDAGGGVLVANEDLTGDRLLAEVLPRIADPERLAAMAEACRGYSPSDADDTLARMALDAARKVEA